MKKLTLMSSVLLMGLSVVTAFASPVTLTCSKGLPNPPRGTSYTTIKIHISDLTSTGTLRGDYEYESIWNGSYPTDEKQSGLALGTLSYSNDGISALFNFVSFDAPSRLSVQRSKGTIQIGSDSDSGKEVDSGLQCILSQ